MPKPLRENTPVIEVRDLEIGYGSFILMREINFSVKAREVNGNYGWQRIR